MQHLRQKGPLSLLAATLTKNIPGGEGDGLAPQVTRQTSQLTAQKVSITSFQFRVSTFGLVLSGVPYFPEGPSPKAREWNWSDAEKCSATYRQSWPPG